MLSPVLSTMAGKWNFPTTLLSPVSGQEGGTFEGEYIPNRQNALERGVRYTNMLNRPEFVGKYP